LREVRISCVKQQTAEEDTNPHRHRLYCWLAVTSWLTFWHSLYCLGAKVLRSVMETEWILNCISAAFNSPPQLTTNLVDENIDLELLVISR
jgi:membrane protein YqaA with SNARE-associated domain